ncbi:MAG: MBOAT family protein [Kiritimatiellae bacterium]|nr:MBOAT family protein [Kiritimatiellia bacterium]
MSFQSWSFAAFFCVFYAGYLLLARTRLRTAWLLLGSYVFYAWWNPLFLLLVLYLTAVDYGVGRGLRAARRKRLLLVLSVVNSVLLLGFFKYAGFVTESLNALLAAGRLELKLPAPSIWLPVGISFFTFRSISYVVDCYRGTIQPERNVVRYAAFIAFFPEIVMGPIERAGNMLPQLRGPATITAEDVGDGLSLFVVGLFKKVALADFLALYVNKVYEFPEEFDGLTLLAATFAFCWQIYFDFSGYTDMARGIARMLGINAMLNFDNPYLATSLSDFWRRWHISLSTWFRDYVYIPLGGSRRGEWRTYRNLIVVMLVSGLWHGAAWTFVMWGFVHALGLCLNKVLDSNRFYRDKLPAVFKRVWVFAFVMLSWVYFRAAGFANANLILKKIVRGPFENPKFPLVLLALVLGVWLYQFVFESRLRTVLERRPVRIALVVLMIAFLIFTSGSQGQAFIYQQF